MELPVHIADRIRSWVAETPKASCHKASFYVDDESARYGGISLDATIGSIWLLRPDGTLWEVDDDSGKPLQPLAEQWHMMALVAGAERHHWLRELVPQRPPGAGDCPACGGAGKLRTGSDAEHFFYCPACQALGWIT